MSDVTQDIDLLTSQICDHETNWSLGTFGAIAEFAREPDEAVVVSRGDACVAVVTARGGIRIEWQKDMRLFASENHDARQLEPSYCAVPANDPMRHEPADGAPRAGKRKRGIARTG